MKKVEPFKVPSSHPTAEKPISGVRQSPADVGEMIRMARRRAGYTLDMLADGVGCAKSYMCAIENNYRGRPPSEKLLTKVEQVLGLPEAFLVKAARWQEAPADIKSEVSRLTARQRVQDQVIDSIRKLGGGSNLPLIGAGTSSLDELYRSGELSRLLVQLQTIDERERRERSATERVMLPIEIPIVNKVPAGYPKEFTDLGYPARVADEYVRSPDIRDQDAFAARVVGASMEPDYKEGDIVVFSPARPVSSGMDCFVRLEKDGQTTFKRVFFERGRGMKEVVRLQPLNPEFEAAVYEREAVAGVYAAVSVTRSIG